MNSLGAILQNYLMNDQYWAWWAIAAVMLIIEVILPSAWLIWPAGAAFVVGLLTFIMPAFSWQWQVTLFILLAFVATGLGRRYLASHPVISSSPNLNKRMAGLMGRKGQTLDDSHDTVNRIRLDDTLWTVRNIESRTLPKDVFVEVVGEQDGFLMVQEIEP